MIDTVRLKLTKFKAITNDNYYCTTKAGSIIPNIDTLKNNSCYWNLPYYGKYQEFHLKHYIKYQPNGYRPSQVVVKDIPKHHIRFWLDVEVALPKVFQGYNLYELQENQFEAVVNSLHDMLLQVGLLTDIEEIRTTTRISRIDFCKNVLIQSSAKDFIQLLQKFQKNRSKTYDEYPTSVLYANKQQGLTAYDKVAEFTKVLRDKSYNNRASTEYRIARVLDEYKKVNGLEVIRIEHRLLNRQVIKRELEPLIGFYPFTLQDVFRKEVCSQLLLKHWLKSVSEEKLKLLLLGDHTVTSIYDDLTTIAKDSPKKFNPLSVLYMKFLSEGSEKEADKRILRIKSPSSLDKYKIEFRALAQQVFFMIHDLTITGTLLNRFKNFQSFPSLLSQHNSYE